MKVILKHDVEKLGRKGDIVSVAPGFGRNYLIPRKLAIAVTASNVKMIEIERQALKKKVEQERKSFQGLIQKLNEVTLTFPRRAGEKDVIFGSVSATDVKAALDELGFDVDKKKIQLDEPIKRLGHFTVPVKVYHEDKAEVKIVVVKEEAGEGETAKPEEKA
jgi:large subunit ribosomal protein L9